MKTREVIYLYKEENDNNLQFYPENKNEYFVLN